MVRTVVARGLWNSKDRTGSTSPLVLTVLTNSARKPKEIASPSVRYEVTEMHLFDLFPQTYHIETLVRLRRMP